MWNEGFIQAELTGDEEVQQQFLQYAEYAEPVRQMPSHRILAVNRGEKLGALKLALQCQVIRMLRTWCKS